MVRFWELGTGQEKTTARAGTAEKTAESAFIARVRILFLQFPIRDDRLLGYRQRDVLVVNEGTVHSGPRNLDCVDADGGTDLGDPAPVEKQCASGEDQNRHGAREGVGPATETPKDDPKERSEGQ